MNESIGPRVFISYAQFSSAHSRRVLALAQALLKHGINADLDQFHQHELVDWPRWCQEQLRPDRSDWVLMVCSAAYRDRLERRAHPGTGKGVFWEGALIDDELYGAEENSRFIPVLLDDEPEESIPRILRGWTFCRVRALATKDSGYEQLCRLLTRQPAVVKEELGPVIALKGGPGEPENTGEMGPASAGPISRCPDPQTQCLSDALDAARLEEERLVCEGADAREVQARILELKRQIRQGGRLRIGDDLLGRYKLIERLGHGGFATIFKAFDTRTRRLVALKVLHGQHGDDKSRVERFFRGARKMAELHHQGIVQVFDSDLEDEGHHFFVMECLTGGDLRQSVLNGTVGAARALDLILGVGAALAFAHGRDIVHRDIKPANIVLDDRGAPKLTDFDLVRAADTTGGTRTSMLGTFGYAAPEMLHRPQDADARADVYGLGMTAIFALHGADPPLPELLRNAEGFIDRLAIGAAVRRVLCRAVAWEVGERYQSVESFCEALREARQATEGAVVLPGVMPTPAESSPLDLADPVGKSAGPAVAGEAERFRCSIAFQDPFTDGSGSGPAMIWLPGGSFRMGSPEGVGSADERPAHAVRLGHYAVGKYPVTVGEFRRFVVATGHRTDAEQRDGAWVFNKDKKGYAQHTDASWRNPYMDQDDTHPVVCISWSDAQAYCDWLTKETGQTYGLLTEAQWEHACRAGGGALYCFGDDVARLGDYAWYADNAGGGTHPVGQKLPNGWAVHDLHGNVWELCRDWYADYSEQPARGAAVAASGGEAPLAENPSGHESGSQRVVRGGAWDFAADFCRSAFRRRYPPSIRAGYLGFRLSRTGPLRSYPWFAYSPSEPPPGSNREPPGPTGHLPRPEPVDAADLPGLPAGSETSRTGLQTPSRAVSEPAAAVDQPRFAPYEVFRDPLAVGDRDGTKAAGEAPAMVYLPGGTFQMGDAQGSSDEQPVHPVRVPDFALGRAPVTWGEYLRFCEATDRHWPKWLETGNEYHLETGTNKHYVQIGVSRLALDLPVVGIAWEDARAYCDWLSVQTGERYALPTEAQWEYACRAGSTTRWCFGDDAAGLGDYAWFSGNAGGQLHPVAQKQANAWGLYDMHGNVWEWCADWYAQDYYQQLTDALRATASNAEQAASGGQQPASRWQRIASALGIGASGAAAGASGTLADRSDRLQAASENPSGPESGSLRVARGGAWYNVAGSCRSAYRSYWRPSDRLDDLGFRLSRTV